MLAGAVPLLLGGCDTVQSALHPTGQHAEEVAGLWWLMFWSLFAAFFVVLAALLLALFSPFRLRSEGGGRGLVVA
ncbi:MAG TPA: hypothetical protein VFG47_20560, partial [Geminicoccaceae bacterium]|nr:hypothetical protein [Geminicoccaceae bacterium]